MSKRDRQAIMKLSPSPERGKIRSKTYQGMADAMAAQWGDEERIREFADRQMKLDV